jgi:hypothetical protein
VGAVRAGTRVLILGLLLPAAARAGDDLLKRWDDPPRVTLKAAKIRVDEAVEKIRKATGCEVVVGANAEQAIELDLKEATFFQAIEEVAQRAGLIVTGVPGERADDADPIGQAIAERTGGSLKLERMPEDMKRIPPVLSGPVRISLLGVYAQRSASRLFSPEASKPDDTPRQLWIEMRVLVEHGLGGAVLKEIRVESAPDDSDRNLAGSKSVAEGAAPGRTARIELEAAGSSALMIRNLNGRATFLVPQETAELRFTAASRNVTKKLGDAKFTFKRLDRKGEDGKPEIAVLLEGNPCAELGGDAGSWQRVTVMTDRWRSSLAAAPVVGIYLYDRSDNPIGTSGSFSSYADDDRESRFTLDDVPARIEVRAVTKVQKREIPFRFAELPIPR